MFLPRNPLLLLEFPTDFYHFNYCQVAPRLKIYTALISFTKRVSLSNAYSIHCILIVDYHHQPLIEKSQRKLSRNTKIY